jgi:hypothetical protein
LIRARHNLQEWGRVDNAGLFWQTGAPLMLSRYWRAAPAAQCFTTIAIPRGSERRPVPGYRRG